MHLTSMACSTLVDSAGTSNRPGRWQLSRCMRLAAPWGQPFREIFLLDKTLGCMQDLIGNGFRGTEGRILVQKEGGEGHALHGGGTTRSAGEDISTLTLGGNMFLFQNGEMWNTTMSVQYALASNGPNDGGFCCISGEHGHCCRACITARSPAFSTQLTLAAGACVSIIKPQTGSHKSNIECPKELRDCAVDMPGLVQPVLESGDMLLFTEALT